MCRPDQKETEHDGATSAGLLATVCRQLGVGLRRAHRWLGRLNHTHPLVVRTVRPFDVGRPPSSTGRSRTRLGRDDAAATIGGRSRPPPPAARCAGDRPVTPTWGRRAPASAADGGNDRWSRPGAGPGFAEVTPGANTTIHATATRTSRITIDTPRRPTYVRCMTLVSGPFQMVDGGERDLLRGAAPPSAVLPADGDRNVETGREQ